MIFQTHHPPPAPRPDPGFRSRTRLARRAGIGGRLLGVALAAATLAGCAGESPPSSGTTNGAGNGAPSGARPLPAGVEAISLLGDTLRAPELPDDTRATYEENLAAARSAYDRAPENADSIIWLGRRTAYLGRYREAIDIYTRGIELHPEDARLYRHRGHRYLSVRELDRAIADFSQAARLVRGQPDRVEPDGIPNARGIPTSTLHFNIWYHLGLAYYAKGDLENAVEAWSACLGVSRNDDSVVATTYWLNNALRRQGRTDRADELIRWMREGMDVIESGSYLDLILLHKGQRTPEDLLGPSGSDATLESTTLAYGVAAWHLVNGREAEAYALMERILTHRNQWPAFGYLAAEADLALRTRE